MWILLSLLACTPSAPSCDDDTTILVEGERPLTCADAKRPTRYIRLLAGAPLPAGSTGQGMNAVLARMERDPTATWAWLDAVAKAGHQLEASTGLEAAEARSAAVYREAYQDGLIGEDLESVFQAAVILRAKDDTHHLALTEADVEGWITYASLCHEVQGAGVLTMSIANRVDIYAIIESRFTQGDRSEQIALTSLGVVWDQVRERWQMKDRAGQQAWVGDAPLPPPMSASSLGYLEAIVEDDVIAHAAILHRHMGLMHFREGDGYFREEP